MLAGTLTVPDTAPAPLPAIVLVHGSGPMDRNETIGPNPVFLQLSNALSNAGYVVLRYDKRGVGQSGGTRDGATRPQLLADATAAYTFVAAQPQVDAQRVFMLGHSEGGELVPTVAANTGAPAGIILMAPPALPLWQISMRQVLASAPPAQEAAARKAELAALAEIRDGSNRSPGMAWYRSSMDVDPVVDIARVACPVLILQGAADVQVAPSDLPRLLAAAKAAHRNVTSYVFPHDNHLFMTVPAGEPATPQAAVHQYLTVPGRIDPDVLAAMLGWLKSTSAAAPAKAA
jgi:dipeptidyl aminopeptidase/acylaminoacyl peptidase